MKRYGILLSFLLLCCQISLAQNSTISILDSASNVSLRGLSVVNDKIIWLSGSNGTVVKSINGGRSFEWMNVVGYEKRDFRDIEAFDEKTAIILGIAEPAIILKTNDGGKSWMKVLEDSTKGMFLDAVSFDKKGNGVVIGDPIDGKIYLARTSDFGTTWIKENQVFNADKGESFFASSGTNILMITKKHAPFMFVSGGMASNLFYGNQIFHLPLLQGKESSGANSIAVKGNKGIIVGGDFTKDSRADSNCVLFSMADGITFTRPQVQPKGYKSCVTFIADKKLVACGTSGVDVSYDGGKSWKNISNQSFHVVQKAKKGKAIFLSGSKGKIARLILAQ